MRRLALLLALLALFGVRRALPPVSVSPPRTVAILGDSVARGAGDESGRGIAGSLREVSVTNLAINGARTWTVLRHLRSPRVRASLRSADAVILSIGGNDLFGDTPARLWATISPDFAMHRAAMRVKRVVGAIRRENASATIYLLGLYNPYRAAWLDKHIARWDSRMIAMFAETRGVTVIRIADLLDTPRMLSPIDHFHPSAAGYRAVAERVAAGW